MSKVKPQHNFIIIKNIGNYEKQVNPARMY